MRLARLDWRRIFILVSIATAVVVWISFTASRGNPVDAWDYWVDPANPYEVGSEHNYLYAPVFAQLISPFRMVGFDVYVAVSRAIELALGLWLAGPALFLALFLPPVATEINAANINIILVVAMVLGFRWPAFWAIILLTKPTMGIGLLWFVFARDWRALGIVFGTTAAISAVSFALNPGVWFDYVRALQTTYTTPGWPFPWPIWVRLPIALPLVLWGSFTRRPWAVALGSMLAAPRLYFLSPVMLLGLLPLLPKSRFARSLRTSRSGTSTTLIDPSPAGREASFSA